MLLTLKLNFLKVLKFKKFDSGGENVSWNFMIFLIKKALSLSIIVSIHLNKVVLLNIKIAIC